MAIKWSVKLDLRIEGPKQSLRDLAQEAIREAILDLRLAPGQRLVERDLCQQLGVSRTVIREVMRYLEAEGLIDTQSSGGLVVASINPSDAEQIYELRAMLEGVAAEACAELATKDDIVLLDGAMEDLRRASQEADPRLSLKAANKFFQHVFAISRKTVASSVVDSLDLRINSLRAMTITSPERQKESVKEMERIFHAIARGDGKSAGEAAIEHVHRAAAVARNRMDRSAFAEAVLDRRISRKETSTSIGEKISS